MSQLLNGLALGSLFMIVSSGLALILGLRGILNFAHGALYMLGAYIAYSVSIHFGFWAAVVIAPLCLAVAGVVMELLVLRPLGKRSPIEVALLTFGLALVIEWFVVRVWGTETLTVRTPASISGTVDVFGQAYPAFRLLLIGVALLVALALVGWLRYSRTGLYVRAASQESMVSSMSGININRLSLVVVAGALGLAGLAGALAAPYLSVQPGMDSAVMITALIVVIVGGLGSVGGAMVTGLVLGIVEVVGNVWAPNISPLLPYAVLILVLLFRPAGLAGTRVE
jgi:branched-chain amino acid transport system permease protein